MGLPRSIRTWFLPRVLTRASGLSTGVVPISTIRNYVRLTVARSINCRVMRMVVVPMRMRLIRLCAAILAVGIGLGDLWTARLMIGLVLTGAIAPVPCLRLRGLRWVLRLSLHVSLQETSARRCRRLGLRWGVV